MTVTFHITNSPQKVAETWECQCVDFDGPWANCHCCQGTGQCELTEPAWPHLNLANTNARNVLRVLGYGQEDDLYGSWEGDALATVISRCLRALNSEAQRVVAVREAYHLSGGHAGTRVVHEGNVARIERMGPETHCMGYSDERVRGRVAELLTICRKAKEEGEAVVWG